MFYSFINKRGLLDRTCRKHDRPPYTCIRPCHTPPQRCGRIFTTIFFYSRCRCRPCICILPLVSPWLLADAFFKYMRSRNPPADVRTLLIGQPQESTKMSELLVDEHVSRTNTSTLFKNGYTQHPQSRAGRYLAASTAPSASSPRPPSILGRSWRAHPPPSRSPTESSPH